jgi:hypothetical protein
LVLSDSLALKSSFEESGIQVCVKPLPRDYRFGKHAETLKPLIDSIRPSIVHSSLFHADMILRYLDTSAKKSDGISKCHVFQWEIKSLALANPQEGMGFKALGYLDFIQN